MSAAGAAPPEGGPAAEGSAVGTIAPLRGFRPDVQALRGIAVLGVVLYHARVVFPGGYAGVDVFFVISGFVIGRRLVAGLTSPRGLSFPSFYVRRARRLLPALGVLLASVLLLAPLVAPIGVGATSSITRRTGVAASLFSANVYLYKATQLGYFGAPARLNPLVHTWSLSVEEQFYLVVPALVLLAWRLGRRRARPVLALGTFAVLALALSLTACVLFSFRDAVGPLSGPEFAFFSPVTRAWEFLAGLVLILLPMAWLAGPRLRRVAVLVGLALIGASFVFYSDTTTFPGVAATVPVLGTFLVIYGGTGASEAGVHRDRSIAWRLLLWFGALSYSWYLWHWPLMVFAAAFWPSGRSVTLVLAGALSLVPAWFSHRFLEQRLRQVTSPGLRPTVVLAACCIVMPLVAAALSVPLDAALGRRTDFVEQIAPHAADQCNGSTPLGDRPADTCRWNSAGADRTVLLIGDSNASQLAEAVIGGTGARGMALQIAADPGCPFVDAAVSMPFTDTTSCRDFVRESVTAIEDDPPDVVVIANSTDRYLSGDDVSLVDERTGDRVVGHDAKADVFGSGLERVIGRLEAAGAEVVVVSVVPKPGLDWDPRQCSNLLLLTARDRCLPAPFAPSEDERLRRANGVEERAATRAGADLWNFNDAVCPDDRCVGERDGSVVWRDGDHVSVATAEALVPLVDRNLRRVGAL